MRKKSVRSILLCMIVILALGCAIILLIITEQPFENDLLRTEKVNKEDEAVYVFEQEAGALQKLKLEPSDDESFIVYSKNAEAAKRGEYLLEGMETFETDAYALNNLIRGVRSFMLSRDLGKQENLVQYGLDRPKVSVTVWLDNTEKISFAVGSEAPSGGNYLLYQNHVYIGKNISWANTRRLELLDPTILNLQGLDIDAQMEDLSFDYLTIQNEDITEPLTIRQNIDNSEIYSYIIAEPVRAFGNDDAIDDILDMVKNLEADRIAALIEENTDLSEYGLDNPQNILTIATRASGTHTLKASNKTNDGWYLMVDDKKLIYLVTDNVFMTWTEKSAMDIRSPLILVPKLSEIADIEIQTEKVTYRFMIDLRGTSGEKQVTDIKGMEIPVDVFRQFYQKMIGLQIYDVWDSEIENGTYMSIMYRYYSESKEDKIIFYNLKESERACLVHVNGEAIGLIKKSTLDELSRAVQKIDKQEK